MKKVLFSLLFVLCATAAYAQRTPHAIGIHFGGSTEDIEYQYHFNKQNFLDITVGFFDFDKGFSAQGLYNYNLKSWTDWTPGVATWKFWGGYGVGVGVYDDHDNTDLFLGPVGTLGFGLTFTDVPITLGVDYRPMVALNLGDGCRILNQGFHNIGLTLTYRF